MEEITTVNYAELCGVLAAPPAYSHSSRGEDFYVFPLDTKRLSGATDRINVVIRKELLGLELAEAAKLRVVGELRSFNNKRGGGARLVITVYARDIALCDDEDANLVCLSGTLCKQPNLRTTPMELDGCADFLKAGCVFADRINTVSPSYAREIRTPYYGEGLEGILNARAREVTGILNGIDKTVFNPHADPLLPARYDKGHLNGKKLCKLDLQQRLGLEVRADVPLFAMAE